MHLKISYLILKNLLCYFNICSTSTSSPTTFTSSARLEPPHINYGFFSHCLTNKSLEK